MRDFKYSEKKIETQDIQELESDFNIKLPKSLKKLLLKYNGGTLGKDVIYIEGEPLDYSFGALYSIKYGTNTFEYSIDILQITEQHIPREYIPFADDQGGNPYTILTKEKDYGKIYIWYMDVGEPERVFVANSLEEFFTGKNEG